MPIAGEEPGTGARPLRVLLWGTYDLGKPRNRILLAGLRERGAVVDECHASVWEGVRDKSELGTLGLVAGLLRAAVAYPRLVYRFLRAPRPDVVIVGYLGPLDVLILSRFARWRRVPLVWDMFLSLHDTLVGDRRRLSRWNPLALLVYAWEWLACRAAQRVVLDTEAHAGFVAAHFRLPRERVEAVWVGVEESCFPRLESPPAARRAPTRILFYGQLIPLHGVGTILAAAGLLAGEPFRFTMIGSGQEKSRVRECEAAGALGNVDWIPWVPYEELSRHLAQADICLGIFGDSGKAARVIPNKVFQIVASGRPLITRDSPAIRELFPHPEPGLALVPPADPQLLAAAIKRLPRDAGDATGSYFEKQRQSITPSAIGRGWELLIRRLLSSCAVGEVRSRG